MMFFQDVPDGTLFCNRDGKIFRKGKHPAYTSNNLSEIPPNAHDPDNPHLYARFGPRAEVEPMDIDVHAIQHDLAATYRARTGDIPRGQLWQPCELPGCDNEPVCMNCLRCQDVHCHCFDD